MGTVYSDVKVETYNNAIWCLVKMYQKVDILLIFKGAQNSFKEMFPRARMFLLAINLSPI